MYQLITAIFIVSSRLMIIRNHNCWMMLMLILTFGILEGCGSKTLSGSDTFISTGSYSRCKEEEVGTVYLPADDGTPLTKTELKAFTSKGQFDRNIASKDMRDILLHFKKYVRRERRTVEINIQRANRYLQHIMETFRQEGLPDELAYLAFIESGYNPCARSCTGASGVWQFTCSTGKHYGMPKNSWVDKRRDPYESTRAAAQYLKRLYQIFQDWHLAITAYNAGEGRVSRALAASRTKTFFELRRRNNHIPEKNRLSEEGKQYLPKFLAICKIVRNLKMLGFEPIELSKSQKMVEVKAKPGTNLKALSRHLGMNWDDFFAHNAAYLKHTTPPGVYSTIYVPHHKVRMAHTFLNNKSKSKNYLVDGGKYRVVRGDTISSIASKTGVSIAELKNANPNCRLLRVGSVLTIPSSSKTTANYVVSETPQKRIVQETTVPQNTVGQYHVVRKGDTLFSIAKLYGVSQDCLVAANNLTHPGITIGQQLYIPIEKISPMAMLKKEAEKAQHKRIVNYQVQDGDSLWSIARKFNVPPLDLLSLNNLSRQSKLRPGDYVQVAIN